MKTLAACIASMLLAVSLVSSAHAQMLQRLTVTSLTLEADRARPQLEEPFHLIVTAHTRERISELDNLTLPILAELELLGDERSVVSDASGTTYREVISVVAHHSGDVRVAPVTLEAIDARDGRGKRYFSSALTLHVSGALFPNAGHVVGSVMLFVQGLIFTLAGIACAVIVVVLLFRRRPVPAPPPIPSPAPVMAAQRSPRDDFRDALLTLQRSRTREGAMRVRTLVRRMVGANDAETLADVLERPAAGDPLMRSLLRALERAAFTHDADLQAALDDAIAQLERVSV